MRNSVGEHLRLIITLALALVKRQHRRDYSERLTSRSDPATRVIAQRVAEAVLRHFEVANKPDRAIGPPLGSGDWRADRPDAGPEERPDDGSDEQAERHDSEDSR